jgi:hypothetical protein
MGEFGHLLLFPKMKATNVHPPFALQHMQSFHLHLSCALSRILVMRDCSPICIDIHNIQVQIKYSFSYYIVASIYCLCTCVVLLIEVQ